MTLAEIIQLKFPGIDLFNQVIIQDDGQGPYIAKWDDQLGQKPTKEMLDQWEVELEPVKYAIDQREKRRGEYPAIGDQLDAMLKYFATQSNLTPELEHVKQQWLDVKAKYPVNK